MAAITKHHVKAIQTDSFPSALFPSSYKTKSIILCIVCFLFYANSIFNKYALDDDMAIVKNTYVQKGFSGIPKILTSDSYASYFASEGVDSSKRLSGGRYRPLSEVVFAIEHQGWGNSEILPYFQHFINIIAYIFCVLFVFYFLDKFLFKKVPRGSDIAFITAILFAIHPIHTEVVANIKSLDEILSLLFIMLTFIYSLKYLQEKNVRYLIIGLCSFLLALLSKEYAVTLIFFIPVLFYLLENKKPLAAILASLPYYVVLLVYLILRYNAVGFHSNIQNSAILGYNPYMYATPLQKIATKWFVLGKYIRLLFFPFPLSCDYSYYQIKYHDFWDISVLFSILMYIAIFVWAILLLKKKNVLSFAAFFFLLNIILVSNFFVDIGATMGERLVFHSTLGFVIILSYYLVKLVFPGSGKEMKISVHAKRNIITGILFVLGLACLGETVVRNTEWKDNASLYTHDVSVVPDSFWINNNAGWGYLSLADAMGSSNEQERSYLDSARKCLFRSLHFNPKGEFTYFNLGNLYFDEGLLDSAEYCYNMVEKLHPGFPDLESNYKTLYKEYFTRGLTAGRGGNPRLALVYMKKALLHDSTNSDIWYNIAVSYNYLQQYDSERYACMKTLQHNPDSLDAEGAKTYLQQLGQMEKQ